MRRILTLAAVTATVALALSGCFAAPTSPVETEQREVDEVSAVVFDAAGDLVITVGEPSLTITGPSDDLARITTQSSDDLLIIAATDPRITTSDLRFELSLPAVSTVKLAGSGDVEVDFSVASAVHATIDGSGDLEGTGIDADTVSVSISGSGDVELTGTAVGVTARLDGSGEIDLGDLTVSDAFIDISGSGDVRVHATRTLRVDISGSGTVRHSGGAEVVTDISGSGEVVAD